MNDTINYRFIGTSEDGRLVFQDNDFPSDAAQSYPSDEAVLWNPDRYCSSSGKLFAVSQRHAEVHGVI